MVEATGIARSGHHTLHAERRDGGRRAINGTERRDLDGCVDIDFETSLVTSTLAVHRIGLPTTPARVPAAFGRADDLRVERIKQTYLCTDHSEDGIVFDYTSTSFDFACRLVPRPRRHRHGLPRPRSAPPVTTPITASG